MLAIGTFIEGVVMRFRQHNLKLSAAVIGMGSMALVAALWLAGDSQSRLEAEGGSSVIAKGSPASKPLQAAPSASFDVAARELSANETVAGAGDESPAELWAEESGSVDDAATLGDGGSPAELWAEDAAAADANGPAELWGDETAPAAPQAPFQSHGAPQSNDMLIEAAARPSGWTAAPARLDAPSDGSYKDWIKARAEEFSGGVDAAGMPLYKFNLWLNAPEENAAQVVQVAYKFNARSATHSALLSQDRTRDFQVQFGAASCPPNVDVELTFTDGRTERHQVNGCNILQ